MSQGAKVPWAAALEVARSIVAELEPVTERVKIAGSLRRRKPEVGDIEIVATPRFEERPSGDVWGTPVMVDLLEERLAELTGVLLSPRPVENHRRDGSVEVQYKVGPSAKLLESDGIPVDLFVVRPPASWGVIFALRTGPGDWNTRLVTECKAIGRRVREGQVEAWDGATSRWTVVPTPEEADFFRELGQPWLEPQERRVDRVDIRREVLIGG